PGREHHQLPVSLKLLLSPDAQHPGPSQGVLHDQPEPVLRVLLLGIAVPAVVAQVHGQAQPSAVAGHHILAISSTKSLRSSSAPRNRASTSLSSARRRSTASSPCSRVSRAEATLRASSSMRDVSPPVTASPRGFMVL